MTVAAGYDPSFLPVPVPLPASPGGDPSGVVELAYTHFTVLLHVDRRLAAATAVNIDGARLVELERKGIDWRVDARVDADSQAGEGVYARNDLDRGHLVRRRDPVWGAPDVAAAANDDTFHYTNAAPQVAAFNQSKELWLGLEDYVLGHAEATDARLTVLTGPVLAADDPEYRGLRVPRRFWKLAAWVRDGELAATGYLLDQTTLLDALLAREAGAVVPADLGAYRTFQVPVRDIAETTGLDLGPLPAADRLAPPGAVARGARMIELTAWEELVL